jgi:hypothetical protein
MPASAQLSLASEAHEIPLLLHGISLEAFAL